ncbi:hypothetical protein Q3G72_015248 [Acer saccharum]|nr:hypothetical protein Q3G72_015248 [Acer saccharum]
MYKANCATSVDKIRGQIGFGVVIRNCNEDVMASCAHMEKANLRLKSAKLTAMYKSILYSSDCGLAPFSFETDEANVVKWILADIDSLSSSLGMVTFSHTDKFANRVAQGLSNFALEIVEDTY